MDAVYMPSVLPSVRSLCASGRTAPCCGHTVATVWVNGWPLDSRTLDSQAAAWAWAQSVALVLPLI